MKILVTGGAGYIGSHTCVELLAAGHDVVVVDNLSNSSELALDRVRRIAGRDLAFVRADLRDADALDGIFRGHAIDAVIHFAALKAVGESVRLPLDYWDANIIAALRLVQAMDRRGVRRLVFSSSATVYGMAEPPLREDAPLAATSPYGATKLATEMMLRDLAASNPAGTEGWRIAILRYFNPVGAHESGLIGEDPRGVPNNLMPYVSQVAVGRLERLAVFGTDYPTPDGTGVRDYIHVVDLAQGHLAALAALDRVDTAEAPDRPGVLTVNLGTGRGYSVLDVVRAFEQVSSRPVSTVTQARRLGDVAACWADAGRAQRVLGWTARLDLERMCADAWRWQSRNPEGYRAAATTLPA